MSPLKKMSKGGDVDKVKHDDISQLIETNTETLRRRQKQIDYGKSTQGYTNYLSSVPKENRSKFQPRTPDKYQVCSRRSYDGQIKIWRLLLHSFDDDRVISKATASDAGSTDKGAGKN